MQAHHQHLPAGAEWLVINVSLTIPRNIMFDQGANVRVLIEQLTRGWIIAIYPLNPLIITIIIGGRRFLPCEYRKYNENLLIILFPRILRNSIALRLALLFSNFSTRYKNIEVLHRIINDSDINRIIKRVLVIEI